jgi:S-adenosylmethionine/arginine decarboxylase-like enzyme
MPPWGHHLVLNLAKCSPHRIRCAKTIENFSRTLVKQIDMVPYGEPQIVHFGTGDKAGFTLVQLIETSNIMAHFSNDTNAAYIDVFSCKPFDPKIVESVCHLYFEPRRVQKQLLKREASIEENESKVAACPWSDYP